MPFGAKIIMATKQVLKPASLDTDLHCLRLEIENPPVTSRVGLTLADMIL